MVWVKISGDDNIFSLERPSTKEKPWWIKQAPKGACIELINIHFFVSPVRMVINLAKAQYLDFLIKISLTYS